MIYSDEELKRWWASLSKQRQREIIQTMVDNGRGGFVDFAERIQKQYVAGTELSPKQIAAIKKWDR